MVVYPGGQCRGDTPPHKIETTGAAGCPAQSENRTREEAKGCPFYRDNDLPFPPRSSTLSLDVLHEYDCPRGPVQFEKDYMMSLITDDIFRAQPMLAHPTTGNCDPIPFKLLEKPPLPDCPRSKAKAHYPPVNPTRPRDLSLRTDDIDCCRPLGTGGNSEGKHRLDKPVDPLDPVYKLLGCQADDPPVMKASGRNSLNVSDIQGTTAKPLIPVRREYGEPLRVEDEFKSNRHRIALSDVAARSLGLSPQSREDSASRRGPGTPRREGPRRTNRSSDTMTPRYRVPLARDSPGTSLCCTWAEEKRYLGASIPTEAGEIGYILGSQPNAHHRDNGEPTFSLETRDIVGGQPQRRIGRVAYNIYGPQGHRRHWNASLDTRDIEGAQADTLLRYPKGSSLNSARSPEDEPLSARGRVLRSCPEKL